MSVRYPSHLFIRVDRELRGALLQAADRAGLTVSALARRELRGALVQHSADDVGSVGQGGQRAPLPHMATPPSVHGLPVSATDRGAP